MGIICKRKHDLFAKDTLGVKRNIVFDEMGIILGYIFL